MGTRSVGDPAGTRSRGVSKGGWGMRSFTGSIALFLAVTAVPARAELGVPAGAAGYTCNPQSQAVLATNGWTTSLSPATIEPGEGFTFHGTYTADDTFHTLFYDPY